jgi:murein DD-endopeptidase MepM/ murein hydrolase activator NlpD
VRFTPALLLVPLTPLVVFVVKQEASARPPLDWPQALPHEEPPAPWRRRGHKRGKGLPAMGLSLVEPSRWPYEPEAPASVDLAPFVKAMQRLCGPRLRPAHARRYPRMILDHAATAGVDPFLLGALVFRSSRCNPATRPGHRGGLITLDYREHAPHVHRGGYYYWVLEEGEWVPRTRGIDRFPFTPRSLRRSGPSLYFAANLLAVYAEQCPAVDSRFGSVPHRFPVSHLVWGDRVEDAGSEERIYTDRRRLLGYYLDQPPEPVGSYEGLDLFCPLDGAPRKIISGLGAIRGLAHHRHRGVDFESTAGEPVRAVAAGRVFRAGVDLRRRGSRPLAPSRSRTYPRSRMGRGGLFVLLQHAGEVTSAYMHLSRFVVRDGEEVRGGQLIGFVGRTGIKRDPAHLHFELRLRRRAVDPVPHLGDSVFPPNATFLGRRIIRAQPTLWRKARYRRRRIRRAMRRRREEQRRLQAEAARRREAAGAEAAVKTVAP